LRAAPFSYRNDAAVCWNRWFHFHRYSQCSLHISSVRRTPRSETCVAATNVRQASMIHPPDTCVATLWGGGALRACSRCVPEYAESPFHRFTSATSPGGMGMIEIRLSGATPQCRARSVAWSTRPRRAARALRRVRNTHEGHPRCALYALRHLSSIFEPETAFAALLMIRRGRRGHDAGHLDEAH
jgi:hypothetical protein